MRGTSMRRCAAIPGAVVAGLALTGCGADFTVTGDSASVITPRHYSVIDLTIDNPHGYPLRVDDVRARILAVDAPNSDAAHPCSSADFALAMSSDTSFTVPARSTRSLSDLKIPARLWPRISLVETGAAQDGCIDATITLGYSADGAATT